MQHEEEFKELITFIDNENPQARLLALNHCVGMTDSVIGKKQLADHSVDKKCLDRLKDEPLVAHAALKILINICTDKTISKRIAMGDSKTDGVKQLFESGIMSSDNKLHPLGIMLLANLTQHDEGVYSALKHKVTLLEHILKFLRGEANHTAMAVVLCNLTRTKEGRTMLTDTKYRLVNALVAQIDNPNPLRRQGVVGTLRNCAFEDSTHELFLTNDVLTPLLMPLVGPDAEWEDDELEGMDPDLAKSSHPDKQREQNPDVRRMLVEIMSLLQKHRPGRESLRDKQVYPVLKRLDDSETVDDIREVICKVVSFLVLYDEEKDGEKEAVPIEGEVPKSCPLSLGFQTPEALNKLGIDA